jgi:hypothetical protein
VGIFAAAVLLLSGHASTSLASMVSSLVINGMSALLFAREDRAHARARERYEELDQLNRAGFLLEICATIESAAKRDQYRIKIIERGLAAQPQAPRVVAARVGKKPTETNETSESSSRG